jgi:hypothetical protein
MILHYCTTKVIPIKRNIEDAVAVFPSFDTYAIERIKCSQGHPAHVNDGLLLFLQASKTRSSFINALRPSGSDVEKSSYDNFMVGSLTQ